MTPKYPFYMVNSLCEYSPSDSPPRSGLLDSRRPGAAQMTTLVWISKNINHVIKKVAAEQLVRIAHKDWQESPNKAKTEPKTTWEFRHKVYKQGN